MPLDNFLSLTITHLKFLEVACSNQMKLHEDYLDFGQKLVDYDSLGFILASVRDILKEFEQDGK